MGLSIGITNNSNKEIIMAKLTLLNPTTKDATAHFERNIIVKVLIDGVVLNYHTRVDTIDISTLQGSLVGRLQGDTSIAGEMVSVASAED